MSSSVSTYLKRKWWKIIGNFFLLIFPIILGLWIVLESPDWISSFTIFYEDNNTIYIINTVFILFVFMSLLPVLVNIFFYLLDSSDQIDLYKGTNGNIKKYHNFSMCLIVLIVFIISAFLVLLIVSAYSNLQLMKLTAVVSINSILSIAIFVAFSVMDVLSWKSGIIMGKEKTNRKMVFIIKRSAMESLLFIDVPALLIVLSSVFFLSELGDIDYFKSFLSNPRVFLKSVTVLLQNNQREVIELFPNGIETGVIMTSIIYSQILYFILKVKWDYVGNRHEPCG